MKWRETRHRRERLDGEVRALVGAQVVDHAVHALFVLSPVTLVAGHASLYRTDIHARWKEFLMSYITTKDGTEIYYKDWGEGQPIVFSHGWPLSADAFEDQMFFLAQRGYRCIA